jgi:hypothetical protein
MAWMICQSKESEPSVTQTSRANNPLQFTDGPLADLNVFSVKKWTCGLEPDDLKGRRLNASHMRASIAISRISLHSVPKLARLGKMGNSHDLESYCSCADLVLLANPRA